MAKTYEYTGITDSNTSVFPAAKDLGVVNGLALALGKDGLSLPDAGASAVGIALVTEDQVVKAAEDVTVQTKDIGLARAGAAFKAGALLAADATGKLVEAKAGQWIFARALAPATDVDDLVKVQVINAGYHS